MRFGLAAMLCGVPLVACSLGSPTSESESKQATTTSVPVPTRASSRPSDASWADARDLRVRAAHYIGKKCFGERATLLGTPGDDRIRATSGDDVIITLGGHDVIVGPKGAELGTPTAPAPARTKSSTIRASTPPGPSAPSISTSASVRETTA